MSAMYSSTWDWACRVVRRGAQVRLRYSSEGTEMRRGNLQLLLTAESLDGDPRFRSWHFALMLFQPCHAIFAMSVW